VVRSFKKVRRSGLIGRFHLSGLPLPVIAGATLVPDFCGFMSVCLRLCDLDWNLIVRYQPNRPNRYGRLDGFDFLILWADQGASRNLANSR
jgi:hypothetical protein